MSVRRVTGGYSFKGYSESMPSNGYTGCSSGTYRRYASLPTVAFVTPNLCDDMHDCSIGTGNAWLQRNIDAYAQWAKTHNSLLIVNFDEDNSLSLNHIYTTGGCCSGAPPPPATAGRPPSLAGMRPVRVPYPLLIVIAFMPPPGPPSACGRTGHSPPISSPCSTPTSASPIGPASRRVMYAIRRGRTADVWSVPSTGGGTPDLLIPDAESPAALWLTG